MTSADPTDDRDDLAGDFERWRQAHDHGTFEETFQALEAVVQRLERGQLRLHDSVDCYELGVRLARRCAEILDQAELRVSQLDASLETPEGWEEATAPLDNPNSDAETG